MAADPSTIAIVCYCPTCDYFVATAVQPDAIGTHGCTQCGGLMQVYIAQGSREVVKWHDGSQAGVGPHSGRHSAGGET